jgi:(E)-4-hydroxy-3-methylbut-2-enyl-diphosphate synthase
MHEAMVQSALLSAEHAEKLGMGRDRIILSAKVSQVQDLVACYTALAAALRLCAASGPHRSGHGLEGHCRLVRRAVGILLQQGIGDTIRISLTPEPGGDRTKEVQVAQELLQTMGIRSFVPVVAACPGCGRTTSTTFQELAQDVQNMIRREDAGLEGKVPRC